MAAERLPKTIRHTDIQILRHGEIYDSAFHKCVKKEFHEHYIKTSDTSRLHKSLSTQSSINDVSLLKFTSLMCNLTTLIEVPIGQGVRCGTGFVQKVETVTDKPCPCPQCKGLGKQQWGKVTLATSLNVLKEEEDAANCQVRLFYDSDESGDQEKIIHGLKSHSRDVAGDWCALVCVTHDGDLLRNLEDKLKQYWRHGHELKEKYQTSNNNLVVVVSHPHGGPKCVSVGKAIVRDLAREVREDQDWCHYSYDAVTCDGSSGAPVYVLGRWNDGFGYWFGHSHNHSGIDSNNRGRSTVGVDSTFDLKIKSFNRSDLKTCDSWLTCRGKYGGNGVIFD